MRSKLLLLLAIAAITSPAKSHECQLSERDRVEIDRSVRSFFDALAKDDRVAFERIVTADFLAFELGKRLTENDLFQLVADSHKSGRVINWSIGPLTVRGECNLAWAAWDNDGSAGVPPNIAPRRWMESAVLRKSPTGWRVEFLHSTVIAPPLAR